MQRFFVRLSALAFVALLAAVPRANALDITIAPAGSIVDEITAAVTAVIASGEAELNVTLDTSGAAVVFPTSGILSIVFAGSFNKLTIRGDDTGDPQNAIIRGTTATPVIRASGSGSVVLECLTIEGSGSAGILVQGAVTLRMNACLIQNIGAGPGIDFAVSTAGISSYSVIANSCFSRCADAGVRTASGQIVHVVQSTFVGNNGVGIMALPDSLVNAVACLFYNNGGAGMDQQPGGTISPQYCVSGAGAANGGADNVSDPNPVVLPSNFEIGAAFSEADWPGDVNLGIPIEDDDFKIPSVAAGYGGYDFENQSRGAAQVGADYESSGGNPTLIWADTQISVLSGAYGTGYSDDATMLYVGKGAKIQIFIVGRFDFVGDTVRLVPESGTYGTEGGYIELPLAVSGTPPDLTDPNTIGEGIATYTLSNTRVEDLILDGHARIYLVADGAIYGRGAIETEDKVNPLALVGGERMVIDTTPPELVLGEDATANEMVFAFSDSTSATDYASGFPSDWRPASENVPWNDGVFKSGSVTTVNPQLFTNVYASDRSEPLEFTVTTTFLDPQPDEGLAITVAGFDDAIAAVTTVGTAQHAGVVLAAPTDGAAATPYWVGSVFGAKGLYADSDTDLVTANYSVLVGGAPTLGAAWKVEVVDDGRAVNNDWHVSFIPVATDRAGNTSSAGMTPVEIWWMQSARAKIASSKYQGGQALAPVFSWNLDRIGAYPANAVPCDPVYRYRLWRAVDPAAYAVSDWEPVTAWYAWSRATSAVIDPNLIAENTGQVMLITVQGADEAGNVQVADDLLGNRFAGLEILGDNGIDFDYWYNPGSSGALETAMAARLWHNRSNCGANDPYCDVRAVDPGEPDFGGGPRVPLPADHDYYIVEALFDIAVQSPDPANSYVKWELYEDGVLVSKGTADTPTTPGTVALWFPEDFLNASENETGTISLSLYPPDRLYEGFGDWQKSKTTRQYLLRAWAVQKASGLGEETEDTTPATKSFTVYVAEESTGEEQPFKVYVRGE